MFAINSQINLCDVCLSGFGKTCFMFHKVFFPQFQQLSEVFSTSIPQQEMSGFTEVKKSSTEDMCCNKLVEMLSLTVLSFTVLKVEGNEFESCLSTWQTHLAPDQGEKCCWSRPSLVLLAVGGSESSPQVNLNNSFFRGIKHT